MNQKTIRLFAITSVSILLAPFVVFTILMAWTILREHSSIAHFVQGGILVCSGTVALLAGSTEARARRIGFVFGLCGQPFWFYTAYQHCQWAIMLLACWFTFCHWRGFWNNRPMTIDQLMKQLRRDRMISPLGAADIIPPRFHA
jgi:hypothetical protein